MLTEFQDTYIDLEKISYISLMIEGTEKPYFYIIVEGQIIYYKTSDVERQRLISLLKEIEKNNINNIKKEVLEVIATEEGWEESKEYYINMLGLTKTN